MRLRPRGRVISLLAWGLLVGGVALLITFPGATLPERLHAGLLPGAILFVVAGLVFGLSHPDGRDWLDAALLGWLPLAAGIAVLLRGDAPAPLLWLTLALLPAALAAAGAGLGALVGRRR